MHSAQGCSAMGRSLSVYVEVTVIGTCAWRPACVARLRLDSHRFRRWLDAENVRIGDAEAAGSQTEQRRIFEGAAEETSERGCGYCVVGGKCLKTEASNHFREAKEKLTLNKEASAVNTANTSDFSMFDARADACNKLAYRAPSAPAQRGNSAWWRWNGAKADLHIRLRPNPRLQRRQHCSQPGEFGSRTRDVK